MNIKGLTLDEISKTLEPFLVGYFKGCQISNLGECMFAESFMFDFEEIAHLVPKEHHHLFKSTDKFNGASGSVQFNSVAEAFQKNEYTAILLTNEDYTKALIFGVEETENATNISKIIVLKIFLT